MGSKIRQASPMTFVFLFTDLEGSTRLWQQHPEAMKQVLARHDEIVRSAVENADGQIVKTTGDGFHAVFNSAHHGLNACIAAQRRLQEESWAETGPLHVRMGLHMGEAQSRSGDYYGTAVNRAARLMAAANGGQVLLSAAVAEILAPDLPPGVSLRDLGDHRLKDLLRPEHIFQLVHPQLPADFPAIASLNYQPNNLPSQPSLFVGRQAELHDIKSKLTSDKVRLLTLIGPGGTGKTRLALQSGAELSDRFIDGTYFIDLAPVREPETVLVTIARTIGLGESKNGSMLEDLKAQLGEKRMLLLLDNFEQVTSAAAQVANLLQYCPKLKMLVTSREALRVRGEYLYPVPPLAVPKINGRHPRPEELVSFEAVQLFLDRAQAVRPEFRLTAENAEAVAELCLRLDGLPLAIELAAARIRLFSPEALRQRLGSRLKLLRGGARDLPQRQQTLRDTIDWSYELLSSPEKSLFAVLSVFSSCTFESAEIVAGEIATLEESEMDIFTGLESLVEKSLLRLVDDGAGGSRLRMLETIREYAADQLIRNSDLHQISRRAHAEYFTDFTQEQRARLAGYEREESLAALVVEVENLKIAWQFWMKNGDLEQLQKMIDGLWLLYEGQGWYQAMAELTSELLDVLSMTPTSKEHVQQEIMLRTSLARSLMVIKGFTPEVEQTFKKALALSEEQGEIPQIFPVLRGLASYYLLGGYFDKALQMGERILDLAERRDDDSMRMHAYLLVGTSTGFISSLQDGLAFLEKGIALYNPHQQGLRRFQIGNNPGIVCHTASAIFLRSLGYPDQAVKRAEKAMELANSLKHPYTMIYALFHTALLNMWCGELERAHSQVLTLKEITQEYEYPLWNVLATILFGAVQSRLGKTEEGLLILEEGIAAYLGHITPPVFWPFLTAIRARAYGLAGKPGEGLTLLNELLQAVSHEMMINQFPDLALLKGELIMDESPANAIEAARLFKEILAGAELAGNKMLALQAATSLCKLQMQDGKAEEEASVLSRVYNSFTEGFETIDLQEAKTLLDKLPN